MIFLSICTKFIFSLFLEQAQQKYKRYCYRSIENSTKELDMVYLKKFGEPPLYMKITYTITEYEDEGYDLISETDVHTIFFKRSPYKCKSTIVISNKHKKTKTLTVNMLFYSGNYEQSFDELEITFKENSINGIYSIYGWHNFFQLYIKLKKNSEKEYVGDSIDDFPNSEKYTINPNKKIMYLCLTDDLRALGVVAHFQSHQSHYFHNIISLTFYCGTDLDFYKMIHLSAWECNFDIHNVITYLYYPEDCSKNDLKIHIKNLKGEEFHAKIYIKNISSPQTNEEDAVGFSFMEIGSLQTLSIPPLNDPNSIYIVQKSFKYGTCTGLPGKDVVLETVYNNHNQKLYLWYIGQSDMFPLHIIIRSKKQYNDLSDFTLY